MQQGQRDCSQQYFDGWEVYNSEAALCLPFLIPYHANTKSKNYYAGFVDWSDEMPGAVANGDGHSEEEVAQSYTTFSFPQIREILDPELIKQHLRLGVMENRDVTRFKGKRQPAKLYALRHCIRCGLLCLQGKKT